MSSTEPEWLTKFATILKNDLPQAEFNTENSESIQIGYGKGFSKIIEEIDNDVLVYAITKAYEAACVEFFADIHGDILDRFQGCPISAETLQSIDAFIIADNEARIERQDKSFVDILRNKVDYQRTQLEHSKFFELINEMEA